MNSVLNISKRRKLLFVTFDASRTGAPIILLHFIEWLKRESQFDITILLMHGGPLQDDFSKLAPTYIINRFSSLVGVYRSLTSRFFKYNHEPYLPQELRNSKFDLIYLNTVPVADLAPLFKRKYKCKILLHVHENSYTINYLFPNSLTSKSINSIDRFIAVSNSTLENLVNQFSIENNEVSLVHECINVTQTQAPLLLPEQVKQELNIGKEEFIVGCSGVTSWRKGVDLFVQLAVALRKASLPKKVRLLWVGTITREFACAYEYEAKRLDLTDEIIFTGSKANPNDYFQIFDVFTLMSREDPFPLVALEAAAMAKPIVCFENSGGIAELIKSSNVGIVVPYNDVNRMVIEIVQLMDSKILSNDLGESFKTIVKDFDVNIIGKKLLSVINETLM